MRLHGMAGTRTRYSKSAQPSTRTGLFYVWAYRIRCGPRTASGPLLAIIRTSLGSSISTPRFNTRQPISVKLSARDIENPIIDRLAQLGRDVRAFLRQL